MADSMFFVANMEGNVTTFLTTFLINCRMRGMATRVISYLLFACVHRMRQEI